MSIDKYILSDTSYKPTTTHPLSPLPACQLRSSTLTNPSIAFENMNTIRQYVQGFQRVADHFDDTCLDNPKARELYPAIVSTAQSAGWLDSSFQVCKLHVHQHTYLF